MHGWRIDRALAQLIPEFSRSYLQQLLAVESVNVTLDAQTLGRGNIGIPMYQYHGQADEFIPLDQAVSLKKAYCAKSTKVNYFTLLNASTAPGGDFVEDAGK